MNAHRRPLLGGPGEAALGGVGRQGMAGVGTGVGRKASRVGELRDYLRECRAFLVRMNEEEKGLG